MSPRHGRCRGGDRRPPEAGRVHGHTVSYPALPLRRLTDRARRHALGIDLLNAAQGGGCLLSPSWRVTRVVLVARSGDCTVGGLIWWRRARVLGPPPMALATGDTGPRKKKLSTLPSHYHRLPGPPNQYRVVYSKGQISLQVS
jgi:hypothetical protein